MKKVYNILLILVLFGLTNCSNLKKSLGFEKDVPDEFLIKKSDPIERPPNFELMPPGSNDKVINSKNKQNKKNNTKRIIDEVLKNNESKEIASPNKSSSLEKDILNQIENR